jgi:hypothetical protein
MPAFRNLIVRNIFNLEVIHIAHAPPNARHGTVIQPALISRRVCPGFQRASGPRALMAINVRVRLYCFAAMRFRVDHVLLLAPHGSAVISVLGYCPRLGQGHLPTPPSAPLVILAQWFIPRRVQNASSGDTIGETLAFGNVACDVRFEDSSSSSSA